MILAPTHVPYDLIWDGRGGRLREDVTFGTGILGHAAYFRDYVYLRSVKRVAKVEGALLVTGELIVYAGTEYDFGSGPAVDTPAVVIASLAHDMICHLTNARAIPWACRAMGDRMYREMMRQNGAGFVRRWGHWLGVRGYSELIARWRDRL